MTQDGAAKNFTTTENAAEHSDRLQVVINDEEQYSIWPAHKEPPAGWHSAGYEGSRQACLAHIEEVWTDMRPLSVRRRLS